MVDSRRKGMAGELEVIHLIRHIWPECARNLEQYQHPDGRDIANTDPVVWQVKRAAKQVPWRRGFEEAAVVADPDGMVPICVTRANREGWFAHLRLDDLIDFIKAWRE